MLFPKLPFLHNAQNLRLATHRIDRLIIQYDFHTATVTIGFLSRLDDGTPIIRSWGESHIVIRPTFIKGCSAAVVSGTSNSWRYPRTGLTGKYAAIGITAYQPVRVTGHACNVDLTQLQNTASRKVA